LGASKVGIADLKKSLGQKNQILVSVEDGVCRSMEGLATFGQKERIDGQKKALLREIDTTIKESQRSIEGLDGGQGGGVSNGNRREILKKIDETILGSKKKIRELDLEGKNFPETKNSIVDDMVRQIDFSRVALEKLGTLDGDSQVSPL
jgi:hypothetical protein